jgi:hypothetical protein
MATTFDETLKEILRMHDEKSVGYGSEDDPFANIRASEQFGIPAWVGAILRMNDKVTRIKNRTKYNKELPFESAREELWDIAVYGAIALTLYDQAATDAVIAERRAAPPVERPLREDERLGFITVPCADWFEAFDGAMRRTCILQVGHEGRHCDDLAFTWKQLSEVQSGG